MSGPGEIAVMAGALLDASAKGGVLLSGLWALSRLPLPLSASLRHRVWTVGLGALPVLALFAVARGPAVAVDAGLSAALLWGFGVIFIASRWGWRWQGLRSLAAHADRSLLGVRVGYSRKLRSPVTFGAPHPVVLLPEEARQWQPQALRAALMHELAHVRRRDWWTLCLADAVCALFWFHPLVWLGRRALLREAEHAADDAVLQRGLRPTVLADLLVQLQRARPLHGALAAAPSELSRRVHALLEERPRLCSPALTQLSLLTCLGAVVALGSLPLWTAPPEAQTCQPAPESLP